MLGVGAALVLAGGTSWLVGYLRYQDLYDHCKKIDGCTDSQSRDGFEEKQIGPLTVTGASIAAVGAALLLATAGIELWQRSDQKRLQVTMSLSELRLSGRF